MYASRLLYEMSESAIAHIRRVAPGSVSDENIRAMLQATGEPKNQLFASPLISS